MRTRPVRICLVHPGASWSTADVYDGLLYGLRTHGAIVDQYRLDLRLEYSKIALRVLWRQRNKRGEALPAPNHADMLYHAGTGALENALRHQADVVLIVSCTLLHPDIVTLMKRAGLRVVVLFTESPYDLDKEVGIAALVDGGWTNERSSLPAFRAVNPNIGYLPHGWHPLKHYPSTVGDATDVPAHDVLFVGSGFGERVDFFNRIDWTGIDLGLYGSWKGLGLTKAVQRCVKGAPIDNERAAALYRRAKIGLSLHRSRSHDRRPVYAESLGPRAYELAACGTFTISDRRAEVRERFGDVVPTFTTPAEAETLIRQWLADDPGRAQIARSLPAAVAEASWQNRAATVLGDLRRLFPQSAAA